jgi:hypothetical protein
MKDDELEFKNVIFHKNNINSFYYNSIEYF